MLPIPDLGVGEVGKKGSPPLKGTSLHLEEVSTSWRNLLWAPQGTQPHQSGLAHIFWSESVPKCELCVWGGGSALLSFPIPPDCFSLPQGSSKPTMVTFVDLVVS